MRNASIIADSGKRGGRGLCWLVGAWSTSARSGTSGMWSNSQTVGSHTVNHMASTVTADAPREDTRTQIEDEDDVA